MKAYGLALVLRNDMGIRTEIYIDPVTDEDRLKVRTALGPRQLEELREYVRNVGWALSYEPNRENRGTHELRIMPRQERERWFESGE